MILEQNTFLKKESFFGESSNSLSSRIPGWHSTSSVNASISSFYKYR